MTYLPRTISNHLTLTKAATRLTRSLGKAEGNPRASYTDRIMDIVRNLRKQKLGTEKVGLRLVASPCPNLHPRLQPTLALPPPPWP